MLGLLCPVWFSWNNTNLLTEIILTMLVSMMIVVKIVAILVISVILFILCWKFRTYLPSISEWISMFRELHTIIEYGFVTKHIIKPQTDVGPYIYSAVSPSLVPDESRILEIRNALSRKKLPFEWAICFAALYTNVPNVKGTHNIMSGTEYVCHLSDLTETLQECYNWPNVLV